MKALKRKKSNRVDHEIARLFAKMAQAAGKAAIIHAQVGEYTRAENDAGHARKWLEMAGADAARDYFSLPPG